jgi:hypothetical protein
VKTSRAAIKFYGNRRFPDTGVGAKYFPDTEQEYHLKAVLSQDDNIKMYHVEKTFENARAFQ